MPSIPTRLKKAFEDRELTLYLGAGVSIPSGLPSWDRLIRMMYLAALGTLGEADNPLVNWRVFPNYLEAVAEWLRRSNDDTAEITAQKILQMIRSGERSRIGAETADKAFMILLRDTLYARLESPEELDRGENHTLTAVEDLCCAGGGRRGVRCVVSYNYDNLVEQSDPIFAPIWESSTQLQSGKVPVFHVHGYLPQEDKDGYEASEYRELILTEEQFHAAASNPYSWSNLVQMRQLGSNVGLMIGMSVTDRNLRRLLEAMRKLPDLCPQYAILRREPSHLDTPELEEIEDLAKEYGEFRKRPTKSHDQIQQIYGKVQEFDVKMTEEVLNGLGVEVIWVDEFDEIPGKLKEIRVG